MNEKLTERVMGWVENATQQIGDFASKEVPPFITEYLTWKFWEGIIDIFGYISTELIMIGFIFGMYKLMGYGWAKYNSKPNDGYDVLAIASTVIGAVISIIFSIHTFAGFPRESVVDCVKIKIAPKVYLVEKAAELIRK
jgi:hypothetical protein